MSRLIANENAYKSQIDRAGYNRAFPSPEEANMDLIARLKASVHF